MMNFRDIRTDEIAQAIEFGGLVDEACSVIQDGAGCENCPIKQIGYCGSDTTLVEMYCISTDVWQGFFRLAQDIEDRADFEAFGEGLSDEY